MNNTDKVVLARFLHDVSTMQVHSSKRFGRSLKKPLLLLLLISKIEHGLVRHNRFRFRELRDELAELIDRYGGRPSSSAPVHPFSHLRESRFWVLTTQRSYLSGKTVHVSDLMHDDTYGAFTPEVFALLMHSTEARQLAFQHVLDEWCPARLHEELRVALKMPRLA